MLNPEILPLSNARVRLRALHPKDAIAFAQGTEDSDVQTYGHLPEPEYTPESVVTTIEQQVLPGLERGDLAVLTIADGATDEFAGSLVIFDVKENSAEVGFWLHPEYRGSGKTLAALDLALEFVRRSGLHRLIARTLPENIASQRVLTKAGFTLAGRNIETAPSGREVELLQYVRATE